MINYILRHPYFEAVNCRIAGKNRKAATASSLMTAGVIGLLMTVALLPVACTIPLKSAFNEQVTSEQFATVAIADLEEALTFARTGPIEDRRVIAVTGYASGTINGVDLSKVLDRHIDDPITVYLELGYEPLRHLIDHAPPEAGVSIPYGSLVSPVDLSEHHIAAATNFPLHAGETSVEGGPFLFPKIVEPTGPYDNVSAGDGLLDYEVELAWVTLRPLPAGHRPKEMGLILCNDYSDRATLLRHVDTDDVESGRGFTTGKSFPGYLPVGNLFVIPKDFRAFTSRVKLELYVNDSLRQRSMANEMIWDVDRTLDEIWKRRHMNWDHKGEQISLLGDGDRIEARVLIMSGTPHGVVFQGIPIQDRLEGALDWMLGGWDRSLPANVIEAYIHDAKSDQIYLQPGDRVVIHVDRLGVIDNRITH
mgnify:CR=1 FL=1